MILFTAPVVLEHVIGLSTTWSPMAHVHGLEETAVESDSTTLEQW